MVEICRITKKVLPYVNDAFLIVTIYQKHFFTYDLVIQVRSGASKKSHISKTVKS